MKRKLDILLIVMFLFGSMIFLCPIFGQIKEVEEDDRVYTRMSAQVKPPQQASGLVEDAPSPAAAAVQTVLPLLLEVPLPEKTAVPAAAPSPVRPAASDTAAPAQAERTANPRSVDVEACVAQNPDFAAWLTIPGTPVDYPVVRSNRTDYYLTHLFSGESSKLGCLFSLPSADYQTPSRNIAIYGHHLSHSDAMFSSLVQYKDSSYCAAHSTIQLYTIYGERTYRIFAVVNMQVGDWDAAAADFASGQAFQAYVDRARAKALYDSGAAVGADDHILTLITCDRSAGGASGRLIVLAVQE